MTRATAAASAVLAGGLAAAWPTPWLRVLYLSALCAAAAWLAVTYVMAGRDPRRRADREDLRRCLIMEAPSNRRRWYPPP